VVGSTRPGILNSSQSCRHRQIGAGASPKQGVHRFRPALQGGVQSAAGIGSMIAKQTDEWNLHATFTHDIAGHDEHERLVERGLFHAGVENNPGYFNDVAGQVAMTNRVLRYEFQQRWILKIVSAFEDDPLTYEIRMLPQVSAQTCYIAGIEKFHASAKCGVLNPFVVRQTQLIGERRPFDVSFQPRPTRKPGLARNGELRIAKAQVRIEDFGIGCAGEARVKFSDPLRHS
jgi:hypothetical protein